MADPIIKQSLKPLKINLDYDPNVMKSDMAAFLKGVQYDINNGTVGNSGGQNLGILTPQLSNVEGFGANEKDILPAGVNITIGSHYDRKTNQLYWFNWNENADHNIWLFDANTEIYYLVLVSSLLNFQLSNRLSAIDLILLDNSNNVNNVNQFLRLLYFTDGYNPPRKFDIDKALNGDYNVTPNWYVTPDEYLRAVKYPPYLRPHGILSSDANILFNNINGKQFQFRYRFIYDDREKSKCSPISDLIYTYISPCDTSTASNLITLTMLAGSIIVERIEVMYREGNFGEWRSIDVLNKTDIIANYTYNAADNTWQYKFYNNKAYTPIAPEITNPNFDIHPLKCFAQEFIETNQIAYANILEGYDNVDWATKDDSHRPTISVVYNSEVVPALRTLTFDIVIHNIFNNNGMNEPIHKGTPFGSEYVWGGLQSANSYAATVGTDYKQSCPNIGFTAYIPATNYYANSQQYTNIGGVYAYHGAVQTNTAGQRSSLQSFIQNGDYFVQRIIMTGLPQQKCVIRVCDPQQTVFTGKDYQYTSTYVAGFTSVSGYASFGGVGAIVQAPNSPADSFFEFEVDLCAGDYNMTDDDDLMMVIWDLTSPKGAAGNSGSTVNTGYLQDFLTPQTGIELTSDLVNNYSGGFNAGDIVATNTMVTTKGANNTTMTTDHNGFYFHAIEHASANIASTFTLIFKSYYNGVLNTLRTYNQPNSANERADNNFNSSIASSLTDGLTYIKGQITNGGIGVSNVPVVYTRGHWALTDSNGDFSILVHTDSYYGGGSGRKKDLVLIEQNGLCTIDFGTDADTYCHVEAISISELKTIGDCPIDIFNSTTFIYLFPQNCAGVTSLAVSILFFNEKGLKAGGRYKFGIVYYDEALRETYVQYYESDLAVAPQSNTDFNQYILSQPEKYAVLGAGNEIGFPTISVLMNGTVHPSWAKYLAVVRTFNVNLNDTGTAAYNGYLQWALSDVKFEDDYGAVATPLVATKVRIRIDGLNEFNSQHYNTTTTTYQFTEGDKIRLIINGNGTTYTTAVTLTIQDFVLHSTDSISFVIDNNNEISVVNVLQKNAFVEFMHPQVQETTDIFYEVSDLYPIKNNQICDPYPNLVAGNYVFTPVAAQTIVLNTWDTYFVKRAIPQTDAASVPTGIFILSQPYESTNYSDLFASKGQDIGRINVINLDAKQIWKPALVRWSYVFIPSTRVNGLSSFDEANSKQYYRQYGGIVKLQGIQTNLYLIQEEKWFRVMLNKNLLTTADSQPLVSLTSQLMSDPVEGSGLYGCQNAETFDEYDGIMMWTDVKRAAMVMCDGNKAIDVSDGKFKSYLINKLKYIENINNTPNTIDYWYMQGKIDVKYKDYTLTFMKIEGIRQTPILTFINNLRGIDITKNETIVFNIPTQELKIFAAYTSEFYGIIDGHRKGLIFVAFKNGSPFYHNNNTVTTFNTFFGVKTDQVIDIISNAEAPSDIKVYGNIAIESPVLGYEADKITSSDSSQLSLLLQANFEQFEQIFYSDILCDINSVGNLIDGDSMRGNFIRIRLIRDVLRQDEYSELNNIIIYGNKSFLSNK